MDKIFDNTASNELESRDVSAAGTEYYLAKNILILQRRSAESASRLCEARVSLSEQELVRLLREQQAWKPVDEETIVWIVGMFHDSQLICDLCVKSLFEERRQLSQQKNPSRSNVLSTFLVSYSHIAISVSDLLDMGHGDERIPATVVLEGLQPLLGMYVYSNILFSCSVDVCSATEQTGLGNNY